MSLYLDNKKDFDAVVGVINQILNNSESAEVKIEFNEDNAKNSYSALLDVLYNLPDEQISIVFDNVLSTDGHSILGGYESPNSTLLSHCRNLIFILILTQIKQAGDLRLKLFREKSQQHLKIFVDFMAFVLSNPDLEVNDEMWPLLIPYSCVKALALGETSPEQVVRFFVKFFDDLNCEQRSGVNLDFAKANPLQQWTLIIIFNTIEAAKKMAMVKINANNIMLISALDGAQASEDDELLKSHAQSVKIASQTINNEQLVPLNSYVKALEQIMGKNLSEEIRNSKSIPNESPLVKFELKNPSFLQEDNLNLKTIMEYKDKVDSALSDFAQTISKLSCSIVNLGNFYYLLESVDQVSECLLNVGESLYKIFEAELLVFNNLKSTKANLLHTDSISNLLQISGEVNLSLTNLSEALKLIERLRVLCACLKKLNFNGASSIDREISSSSLKDFLKKIIDKTLTENFSAQISAFLKQRKDQKTFWEYEVLIEKINLSLWQFYQEEAKTISELDDQLFASDEKKEILLILWEAVQLKKSNILRLSSEGAQEKLEDNREKKVATALKLFPRVESKKQPIYHLPNHFAVCFSGHFRVNSLQRRVNSEGGRYELLAATKLLEQLIEFLGLTDDLEKSPELCAILKKAEQSPSSWIFLSEIDIFSDYFYSFFDRVELEAIGVIVKKIELMFEKKPDVFAYCPSGFETYFSDIKEKILSSNFNESRWLKLSIDTKLNIMNTFLIVKNAIEAIDGFDNIENVFISTDAVLKKLVPPECENFYALPTDALEQLAISGTNEVLLKALMSKIQRLIIFINTDKSRLNAELTQSDLFDQEICTDYALVNYIPLKAFFAQLVVLEDLSGLKKELYAFTKDYLRQLKKLNAIFTDKNEVKSFKRLKLAVFSFFVRVGLCDEDDLKAFSTLLKERAYTPCFAMLLRKLKSCEDQQLRPILQKIGLERAKFEKLIQVLNEMEGIFLCFSGSRLKEIENLNRDFSQCSQNSSLKELLNHLDTLTIYLAALDKSDRKTEINVKNLSKLANIFDNYKELSIPRGQSIRRLSGGIPLFRSASQEATINTATKFIDQFIAPMPKSASEPQAKFGNFSPTKSSLPNLDDKSSVVSNSNRRSSLWGGEVPISPEQSGEKTLPDKSVSAPQVNLSGFGGRTFSSDPLENASLTSNQKVESQEEIIIDEGCSSEDTNRKILSDNANETLKVLRNIITSSLERMSQSEIERGSHKNAFLQRHEALINSIRTNINDFAAVERAVNNYLKQLNVDVNKEEQGKNCNKLCLIMLEIFQDTQSSKCIKVGEKTLQQHLNENAKTTDTSNMFWGYVIPGNIITFLVIMDIAYQAMSEKAEIWNLRRFQDGLIAKIFPLIRGVFMNAHGLGLNSQNKQRRTVRNLMDEISTAFLSDETLTRFRNELGEDNPEVVPRKCS